MRKLIYSHIHKEPNLGLLLWVVHISFLPLHKIKSGIENILMWNGIIIMTRNVDYDHINTYLYPQAQQSIHPSVYPSMILERNLMYIVWTTCKSRKHKEQSLVLCSHFFEKAQSLVLQFVFYISLEVFRTYLGDKKKIIQYMTKMWAFHWMRRSSALSVSLQRTQTRQECWYAGGQESTTEGVGKAPSMGWGQLHEVQ